MESKYKNISVIGGGNIGTQVACVCAAKGYGVTVYSSRPEAYDGTLQIINEYGQITKGTLKKVTNSLEEAIRGQDVIFVTYPAFKLKALADQLIKYICLGVVICVMPGTGGAEYAFKECINAGAILCGLQRVPSVARLEKYGKMVRCEGLRKQLYLAAIPSTETNRLADFMTDLWESPCIGLPNYLSVTLTPSNPILHTTRLRVLFKDYEKGITYTRNPLFYGEWDNESSALLLACDEELQKLCRHMIKLDLSNVKSLKVHYESGNAEQMTEKLKSIRGLNGLKSPMRQIENGWIPNFESRYFMADFPYGLAIIEELGELFSVDMPNICETMNWYREVTGNVEHFKFSDYGISHEKELYQIYNS